MSYRDWVRGEDGPRERPTASWAEPVERDPDERYDSAVERYRTPSRRRAFERGQDEPAEPYLPRWALESGVRSVDGGGRHAAPDDDDDVERPRYAGGRRSAERGRGRSAAESSRRDTPSRAALPESDHTREWTFDRPQEEGYVGSRRAEDDDPVSGVTPQSRPRRAQSRRRQVTWSELAAEDDAASSSAEPTAEPPSRRRRRAAEPSTPPADPWQRGRERAAEPEYQQPAVDPWDASGLHAWNRSAGDDRRADPASADPWDADSTSQWLQAAGTDPWLEPDSTGQWDRFSEPEQRDRERAPERWSGYSEADRWDRTEPPRSGAAPATSGAGTSGAGQWSSAEPEAARERFWPGTRLAGDDPRWVDAPDSAPRSPVVGYTAPRPRSAPRRRSSPAPAPARPVGMAAVRRRIEAVGSGGWNRRLEDDLLDPDLGGPWLPLLYTAACYLLPAAVIFVWLLTLDGAPPAGCVTDISGGGCDSPRARAFGAMVGGLPRFGLALVSSLAIAMLLRRVGTTWRSTTVALAAAVVGGGLSTVMISAVTGQPIG
ncbi:hypothetical protein [Micromonospora craniellae]|uniref:Uncharacterized protein n=1 Tax=Micromonospora craniellae TaxID=2294034 RepID=A0A372G031_9ACTN|nr:hypothetical protein [Micromonospora craniellae]QOC94502.1 hypothetical protein ID554_13610 [Micromonospora craniellae]RFS46080.1 hypothetical protein D0Q02_13060 [Micromonospora craniellae]